MNRARAKTTPASTAGSFAPHARQLPDTSLPVPVPTVELPVLTHIGSLDPADKQSFSHEGQGLSVSLHPDAWEKIARLGGRPRWQLTVPGNRFVDFHALDDAAREGITAWGVGRGYVREVPAWEVRYWDDELESEVASVFTDEGEAASEAEEAGYSSDAVRVARTSTMVATESFPDSTVKAGAADVFDILTTVWVNEATDMDGVWWEDTFDPDVLSAPRGVIVPRAIEGWLATAVAVEST